MRPWNHPITMNPPMPRRSEGASQLRLLHAITAFANEAPTAEWAMERAIERICSDGSWPVGHVYLEERAESGVYRDQGIWWQESLEAFRPFVRASARILFRSGKGFVGKVIESRRAQYLTDLKTDQLVARHAEAMACGFRSGLALPIMVESRVVGVLEFFSTRRRRVTPSWLDTYSQIGIDLGRIVERKDLEREIAELAAREQQRLGQEIHDTLGQQVTALEMLLKSHFRRFPTAGGEKSASRLMRLAEETKRQVRALSRGLVPVEMESGTLNAALEDLAEQTSQLHGIRCTFRCNQPVDLGDGFAASQVYRIAREGVHNAVKHGNPDRVVIALRERGGLVILQVRDDGRGPGEEPDPGRSGRGLKIMSYRARSLGGSLVLEKHPEGGALLTCTLRRRSVKRRAAERAS